jgi:dihydroorotase
MDLTLTAPDDWHLHVRDRAVLADVVPFTARRFRRAVIMPNLRPPVTTAAQALAYRGRILHAAGDEASFEPLMTLYLTDALPVEEIRRAKATGYVVAAKLYPAGATTHSALGVTDVERIAPVLDALQEAGLLLLVHGEVARADVDIFDREARFLEEVLAPLLRRHEGLRVVLEHVSSREGVEFVRAASPRLAATITAHHLLYSRNDLLTGGLRPHHYCLPVLKREDDRRALVEAATSGSPRFFLGTDSAPHAQGAKEAGCGAAGCFTSHAALELYAEVFERAGALDRLEAFASFHGADFYGMPRNTGTIRLVKRPWRVPSDLTFGGERLVPLRANEIVSWQLDGETEGRLP